MTTITRTELDTTARLLRAASALCILFAGTVAWGCVAAQLIRFAL